MAERASILYDDSCDRCTLIVRFFARGTGNGALDFVPARSDKGRHLAVTHGLDADRLDCVVLIEEGAVWRKSDAVVRMARHLSGVRRDLLLLALVPRPLRDWGYDLIARNRHGGLCRGRGR